MTYSLYNADDLCEYVAIRYIILDLFIYIF